ncbi:ASCH domain-containing protein [Palaeococcus ferrophilus]|uniref:ASCH domain-containing protein n=1 Tax=Palaeococcus ferrophilus TaxID=83868 RepID=UPI00064E7D73|nr:ASCH domain-containing protein [Palaeococcus ferrophilus]
MRHLKFDGRYREAILSGRKRATVRAGKVNLREGDEVFIHAGGYVLGRARIRRVERKSIEELTEEDAIKDGFSSREELLRALREHYPNLRGEVTVVEFELVERSRPVLSSELPYEGNSPLEIARMALKHLDLDQEDERLIRLFLKEGSLRKAAYKLGGMNRRYLIRDALRRAYKELKEKGLMDSKIG